MSRQTWDEAVFWVTSSGTAIASSASETAVFANVTIPANYQADGRVLRVRAFGAYGTTATPTLTFALRWGGMAGTVLAKSAAITTTSGTGGGASMTALWDIEAYLQTRANGISGSLMTNGAGRLFTSAAPTAGTVTNYGLPFVLASGATGGTTPVAVTADLTQDTPLVLTAQWGTSNAANSLQGLQFVIESMN